MATHILLSCRNYSLAAQGRVTDGASTHLARVSDSEVGMVNAGSRNLDQVLKYAL